MNIITKGEYLTGQKETASESLQYVSKRITETAQRITKAKTKAQQKRILDDLTQAALMLSEARAVLYDAFNEGIPEVFDLDEIDISPFAGAQIRYEQIAEDLSDMIDIRGIEA